VPDTIHVILTDYGRFGWGISSPQLPELVGGSATYESLVGELGELLTFGGAAPGAKVVIHTQSHLVLPDGDEVLIRIGDTQRARRMQAASQLDAAMRDPVQLKRMLAGARRPTGELLFICAVPEDELGWVSAQLTAEDVACVVISVDHMSIRTQYVGSTRKTHERPWRRFSDMGFDASTTLIEAIKAQDAGLVNQSELVYA
jgi:hypothetical protein